MKYQVIKNHRSEYPIPILISKGDKLIIGEKFDEYDAWNDWYFCETQSQIKGWVPEQLIKRLGGNEGEILEDYSSKEMNVDEGEALFGSRVLNGWMWCQNIFSKEEGWVPLENLVQI